MTRFSLFSRMSTPKRKHAKDWLYKLDLYLSDPITRPRAYELTSNDSGFSVEALREAAHRRGWDTSVNPPKLAVAAEYEEALVTACIIHARQGTPLTKSEFIELASRFVKKKEGQFFTKGYVKGFLSRHSDELCMKPGKTLSSTRNYEQMQTKTLDFVSSLSGIFEKNIINQNNLVVFDETVVSVEFSLPKAIGTVRNSGGGNVHVLQSRQSVHFCYIPFSLGDGSTPFRVVIYKSDDLRKGAFSSSGLVPVEEKGLRNSPYRLFLESGTGYLTLELFEYIMEEFTKWWTATRPGLQCFMVSDNLRIHTNDTIVRNARTKGIHMFNIMPGSSHWFQVHDQIPFASLKKKMSEFKNEILNCVTLEPKERTKLFHAIFYKSEKYSFTEKNVLKSLAAVGLRPWNPEKIIKNAQENSPMVSKDQSDEMMRELVDAIKVCKDARVTKICETLSSVKCATISSPKASGKAEKRGRPEEDADFYPNDDVDHSSVSESEKSMDTPSQPPRKKRKKSLGNLKKCCVKGCEESHFWSKKWKFCPKCKKNFCPSHAKKLQHHKC